MTAGAQAREGRDVPVVTIGRRYKATGESGNIYRVYVIDEIHDIAYMQRQNADGTETQVRIAYSRLREFIQTKQMEGL